MSKQYKVLLVDDEPGILAGLARSIRPAGFVVCTAGNADDALAQVDHDSFDAVLSDHYMPGMTGIDLLREVGSRQPTCLRFLLTSGASLELAVQAINHGQVHRILLKPCNSRELVPALRELLVQRELAEGARALVKGFRHQQRLLAKLEDDNPGISQVETDASGAIVVKEQDYEGLLTELELLLGDQEATRTSESSPKGLAGR